MDFGNHLGIIEEFEPAFEEDVLFDYWVPEELTIYYLTRARRYWDWSFERWYEELGKYFY